MNKLYVFGDSILKGVMYNPENGRYVLYKGQLEHKLAEKGIVLENLSKMGATVEKGLDIIKSCQGELSEGDSVIIEFGGNDCNYDWHKVSESPEGELQPSTPVELFQKLYAQAIEFVRSIGVKISIATLFPLDSLKFFNNIVKGNDSEKILGWLGDKNVLYRWQEYYNSMVLSLARKYDLPVIDIRGACGVSHCFDNLVCEDGIHPTAKAHSMIEDLIYHTVVTA